MRVDEMRAETALSPLFDEDLVSGTILGDAPRYDYRPAKASLARPADSCAP